MTDGITNIAVDRMIPALYPRIGSQTVMLGKSTRFPVARESGHSCAVNEVLPPFIRSRSGVLERCSVPRIAALLASRHRSSDQAVVAVRARPLRELEALFEKLDFNSFPVVEEGKMLGMPHEPQRADGGAVSVFWLYRLPDKGFNGFQFATFSQARPELLVILAIHASGVLRVGPMTPARPAVTLGAL